MNLLTYSSQIFHEVLKNSKEIGNVKIHSFTLQHKKNNKPTADLEIIINGKLYKDSGTGDGQFDAFMNALRKIYLSNYIELPLLIDYNVTIPPGSNSDSLCETFITWKNKKKEFITRGLDSDQTVSAIKATEKMLNII